TIFGPFRSLAIAALASLLLLAAACSRAPLGQDEEAPLALADPALFPVNVVQNGGFELVADSTTRPPKYGAFWKNAFVPEEGIADCLVAEHAPGAHSLRLAPGAPPVSQIVTLYGPAAERFLLTLRARFEAPQARLVICLRTQDERVLRYALGETAAPAESGAIALSARGPRDAAGFASFLLAAGNDMRRLTGAAPAPWCRVELCAIGGPVLVDDVIGAHYLPRIRPTELRASLLDDVRDLLRIHLAPPGGEPLAGLELVDPQSGYLNGVQVNASTGEVLARSPVVGIAGIHDLMVKYLRLADDTEEGRQLRPLVRDRLMKHVGSVLTRNVLPETGLFCLYDQRSGERRTDTEYSPSHFINYLMDVAEAFPEEEALRRKVNEVCARVADKMVALRDEHDLPADVPFARGPGGNWFGRMPEKVSPLGWLAEPKKATYDQAWAISINRSWYHDFDTAVGLMRVWRENPRADYLRAVARAIQLFDREFDAQRYDLENDTDDHYGKNVEALLLAFRYSGYQATELRDFAQRMTDYRLPRGAPWERNLWIEGIRLGSFTTGDQPRAYRGPVWLHNAPPEANPPSAGLPAYAHAIRELCKGDLRRRLLDDGYMTDDSSYQWEMIYACFKRNYIAPCSEGLEWEGDMGDPFAGPSTNGFRALGRTIEIGAGGPNREFVAWYQVIFDHTLALYRRSYGYLFGMPVETGLRYGVAPKKLGGLREDDPYGNAVVFVHAETLLNGKLDQDPASIVILEVARGAGGALVVHLAGPPGRAAEVRADARARFSDAGPTDWRLLHVAGDSPSAVRAAVTFDAAGRAEATLPGIPGARVALDALLQAADGESLEDLAGGEYRL
ncbi:MAG: hypothetical protein HY812_22265, partial [Planctomycetes bacterium]|nr:hypothetical protein [Planctomycetota bacterium]